MPTALALPLLALLLFGTVFTSAAETALFALDANGRAQLAERGGFGRRVAERMAKEPETFLLTMLLLNLFVNLAFFTVAGAWTRGLEGHPAAFAVPVVAFLLVLLAGEIVPKALAVRSPVRLARTFAPLVDLSTLVLRPLVKPLTFATDVVTGMVSPRLDPLPLEHGELLQLLRTARDRGAVDAAEEAVLEQILNLRDLKARDAMVPRVEIAAIDLAAPRARAEQTVRLTRRSHLPAFRRSIDHVVGYLDGKDLFLRPRASLEELLRPITFVAESAPLEHALRVLRAADAPIGVALDEYGGTAGVLTPEGIAAVLFGGFADEHEQARGFHRVRPDGAVILRGNCPIAAWNSLGLEPEPLAGGRAVTMGGYVAARLDRIPAAGDEVVLQRHVLRVLRTRNGAVRILIATPLAPAAERMGEPRP